jgi:hypothetical protein
MRYFVKRGKVLLEKLKNRHRWMKDTHHPIYSTGIVSNDFIITATNKTKPQASLHFPGFGFARTSLK